MWHKEWIFGIAMCKIYMTTTSINQITSSIFLTVMSADRYVAVCHPISSPKFRTNVIARVVSLTAWATSALLMVPVFMYAATIKQLDGTSETCNIYWPWSHDADNETNAINDTAINDTEAVEGKLRMNRGLFYVCQDSRVKTSAAPQSSISRMLSSPHAHYTFIWVGP